MLLRPALFSLSILLATSCAEDQRTRLPHLKGEGTHLLDSDDALWTVKAGDCAATVLSHYVIVTSTQCKLAAGQLLTSGYAFENKLNPDIGVIQVLYEDQALGFQVVQVRWSPGLPPMGHYVPLYIARSKADAKVDDKVFAVGFPQGSDKVSLQSGNVIAVNDQDIEHSLALTAGHVGASLYRESDAMMLGVVLGGSKAVPAWLIYEKSQAVRDIYPDGKNVLVKNPTTEPAGGGSTLPSGGETTGGGTPPINPDGSSTPAGDGSTTEQPFPGQGGDTGTTGEKPAKGNKAPKEGKEKKPKTEKEKKPKGIIQ